MRNGFLVVSTALWLSLFGGYADAQEAVTVSDGVIAAQNTALLANARGSGSGPQSPRDLSLHKGKNLRVFGYAPEREKLNLCNIHLHENAEHRGGQFTTFAGNGDGHGNGSGFKYDGKLTAPELEPLGYPVGASEEGDLVPGDTVEVHFVYTSADTKPGVTLGSCFTESAKNPQLRVEAVIAVLVNDPNAASMSRLAEINRVASYYQATNLPNHLGRPIRYIGSTTGPNYNEVASPFQVTWSVRPKVLKVDIGSVALWLSDNPFKETHAHGVRNLVTDPELLSPIE